MGLSVPCKNCATLVDVDPEGPIAKLANDLGVFCDACMAMQVQADTPMMPARKPFSVFCPPCFEDTNFEHLPCPGKSTLALDWLYGAEGLNLWGYPGTGKTRTITLILRSMYTAGHKIIALGPGDFKKLCRSRNFAREGMLDRLSKVDILFIDDMDKMNLTAEMEKDLFSVLTNRMGRKPVLLTGNSTAKTIEWRFRLGEPMVRRIRDHCRSIHFDQTDITKKPVTP